MSDIDGNYLKAYTLNQSQQKVTQVQDILSKKLGDKWKMVLFMMLVIIACIISIIIFGINVDDSPYKISLSHVKVFVIILLISISFFIVWAVIKPNAIVKQTGIVPFPPGDTIVPVDSSQCGLVPTLCTLTSDCVSKCGSQNYSCHIVDHPNTYYLGSKLEVGKTYCLPKIEQLKDISGCGTYTGRIVWSKNPDGTLGWQCQCLYPDLFSGSDCTTQKACQYTDNTGNILKGNLVDKDNNIWWSDVPGYNNAPPSNSTPYDTKDGKPLYKCSCPKGLYSTELDPFVCNQDLCYGGYGTTDVASFDLTTNQCVCRSDDPNNIMYKSNISGFCYPIEATEKTCNLNINGDGCKYGVDLFYEEKPIMFKVKDNNNFKYYMSELSGGVEKLIDISDIVSSNSLDGSKFTDISNTVLKDAFYSFPIKKSNESGSPNITSDVIKTYNDDIKKMKTRLEDLVKFSVPKGGLAQKCNSYYYRRDDYPNCDNLLSKTGTQPIVTSLDCGSYKDGKDKDGKDIYKPYKSPIYLNNYPYGYKCDCGDNGRKGKDLDISGNKPEICLQCVKGGEKPDDKDYKKCCVYQFDKDGKVKKEYKYVSGEAGTSSLSEPNFLCGNGRNDNTGDTCCKFNVDESLLYDTQDSYDDKYKCNSNYDCLGFCGYMDDGDESAKRKICCPYGKESTGAFSGWCGGLKKGMRCKHNGQCEGSMTCDDNKCK